MTVQAIGGWDPVWEEIFRRSEWGKYPPEHLIRFVARRWYGAADRKQIRLLDLGCGPGANTWYMAREGFTVSGIDGSPTAIERATARLASEGLAADLQIGDFVALPWPDGTFDGAVDNVTLCCNHFAQAKRAVAEVHRVLKPGGAFLSCNFTNRSWGAGTGHEVEPNGYTDISEGPLEGKGFGLFMSAEQLAELYAPFESRSIELVSWTAEEMRKTIELWTVTCRKKD